MKTIIEFNERDLNDTINHAEQIIMCAINDIYNELNDSSCITYEDIHYVKKCLQTLTLIHDLKH